MMEEGYQVPLLPNDLRREETILHVVGALTHLSKVSNDIFGKIGAKCDEFQEKISGINQRIDIANTKLEVLKETKKATVVFSSARYPGKDKAEDFRNIFSVLDRPLSYAPPKQVVGERVQEYGSGTLQSKLLMVSVKARHEDTRIPDGVGSLPKDLSCAGALTIYNTAESPWTAGQKSDPLAVRSRGRRQEEEEEAAEERGITGGDGVVGREDAMFYSPDLGDLPDFDLPEDLMLPNIAQDLNYSQVSKYTSTFLINPPGPQRDRPLGTRHGRPS